MWGAGMCGMHLCSTDVDDCGARGLCSQVRLAAYRMASSCRCHATLWAGAASGRQHCRQHCCTVCSKAGTAGPASQAGQPAWGVSLVVPAAGAAPCRWPVCTNCSPHGRLLLALAGRTAGAVPASRPPVAGLAPPGVRPSHVQVAAGGCSGPPATASVSSAHA